MTPSQFTRVLTLSFACWSVGASAQSAALKTVEVVATGTASAAADTASFSVGVSAASARATTAVEQANTTLTAIIDALKSQMSKSPNCAVPNALETSGFRVQPRYERKRDQPPQLTGYEVQRTLTVSINNPANCLGLFLDSALNAGATQINSVQRGLSDPQAVQDAARTNAFTQAKRRAEQLAKLAGATLGEALEVEELSSRHGSPRPLAMTATARSSIPTEEGLEDVNVTVRAKFRLK